MERYQGIKFLHRRVKTTFSCDQLLPRLGHWAYLLSQLGLAPHHPGGAFGNHSYRTGPQSFVITRAGMSPGEQICREDFCHVVDLEEDTGTFITEGAAPPSSESFLHHLIYRTQPGIKAILHGHCTLLIRHATSLAIPVTAEFHPYGTRELAESARPLLKPFTHMFILKDHGFVTPGIDLDSAGDMTLDYLQGLVTLLRTS
ncbi:MAG: class II aldolase/adducin family protein [Desulforhopalus sp.]